MLSLQNKLTLKQLPDYRMSTVVHGWILSGLVLWHSEIKRPINIIEGFTGKTVWHAITRSYLLDCRQAVFEDVAMQINNIAIALLQTITQNKTQMALVVDICSCREGLVECYPISLSLRLLWTLQSNPDMMKTLNITKRLSYIISWPIKFYNTACSMFVILGDPGGNSGDEEKVKTGGKNSTKKIREEKRFLCWIFFLPIRPHYLPMDLCVCGMLRGWIDLQMIITSAFYCLRRQ